MTNQDFIKKVGKIAADSMQKTKILASLTTAQAILESGWGKSGLTTKGNALFGIKATATWEGKVYSSKTKECYDGVNFVEIQAAFRAYDSWEESMEDHSRLLTTADRYKALIGEKDYKKACKEIQRAGYATDPTYANKLINLIEQYKLYEYDKTDPQGQTNTQKGNVMDSKTFIDKLYDIMNNYKTVYMWGCFGSPVTNSIIDQKAKQYPSWYTTARKNKLKSLVGKGYFSFDCVNLIKGILWGWNGNKNASWGGVKYASNGVPDINADAFIKACKGVSTNFNNIVPGEVVWIPGHVGVYVGDGKVIEITPSWTGDVQLTALLNKGPIAGLNGRRWTSHGKMPYINYVSTPETPKPTPKPTPGQSGTYKAGDKVTLLGTATKYATGQNIPSSIKNKTYTIQQVKTDRVLLREIYSWVLIKDISAGGTPPKILAVGSTVKITGAKYATGQTVPAWVKIKTYKVSQIKGDRALLSGINSWVNKTDLKVL